MLLTDYPGLARGLARYARVEEVLRTFAMTRLPERINGLEVRQLTPRMFDLLLLVSSPFLITPARRRAFRIRLQPEHVAQFLWIVSPLNPLDGSQPTAEFFKSLRPNDPAHFRHFYRAIDRYYERAMLDKPAGSNTGRLVGTAFTASVVNRIASAYGWPPEVFEKPPAARMENRGSRIATWFRRVFRLHPPSSILHSRPIPFEGILDMPIARLFQYWRWISADRDPTAPLFSRFQDSFKERTILKWRRRAVAAGFGDDITTVDVRAYLLAIGRLTSHVTRHTSLS